MKGITFGNYHSYDDFGLILSGKEIGSPEPKVNQVDVEGSDGVLDYTDYFGDVKFKNRSLSFIFSTLGQTPAQFMEKFTEVHNAIHGKMMEIVLDDDPEFYYVGRVTVNQWKANRNLAEIIIEVDAEPYKMELHEKTVALPATVMNLRKMVVPKVVVSGTVTVHKCDVHIELKEGVHIVPEFELSEGENDFTITGDGSASLVFRRGCL